MVKWLANYDKTIVFNIEHFQSIFIRTAPYSTSVGYHTLKGNEYETRGNGTNPPVYEIVGLVGDTIVTLSYPTDDKTRLLRILEQFMIEVNDPNTMARHKFHLDDYYVDD